MESKRNTCTFNGEYGQKQLLAWVGFSFWTSCSWGEIVGTWFLGSEDGVVGIVRGCILCLKGGGYGDDRDCVWGSLADLLMRLCSVKIRTLFVIELYPLRDIPYEKCC